MSTCSADAGPTAFTLALEYSHEQGREICPATLPPTLSCAPISVFHSFCLLIYRVRSAYYLRVPVFITI